MKTLEKTVDLLTAFVLSTDDDDKARIVEKIRQIVSNNITPPALSAEEYTENLLTHLGVPCNLTGYRYIVTAVCAIAKGPDFTGDIVKGLYCKVAEAHSTTASRVERGIRHAIEIGWQRGDIDVLHDYFECTFSAEHGKPTNCEFLYRLARDVKRKEKHNAMDNLS